MSFLIISLDFELIWGLFDKVRIADKADHFRRTREVVPRILSAFEEYGVAATWATVGMLLTESREEWEYYRPGMLPSYCNTALSPYQWVEKNGYYPEFQGALDLVKQVIDTPGQELGSHTYGHYYTIESGQQPEQFRSDLRTGKRILRDKCGIESRSLVFPRNQYNPESLRICKEEGFGCVRVNPTDWFWKNPQKAGILHKAFRTADALFPFGKKTSYRLENIDIQEGLPLQLPASRFLRPASETSKILNSARLHRVVQEMIFAAKHDLIYHLWWHPHNFGCRPEENMQDLYVLLETFKRLQEYYGMRPINMGQLADEVLSNRN